MQRTVLKFFFTKKNHNFVFQAIVPSFPQRKIACLVWMVFWPLAGMNISYMYLKPATDGERVKVEKCLIYKCNYDYLLLT